MPDAADGSGGLRILLISAQFPFPPRSGFETRVYHLARQLAIRNELTLLSYADAERAEDVAGLREHFRVEMVVRDRPSQSAKRVAQTASIVSPLPFAARSVYSDALQRAVDRLLSTGRFDVVQLESSVLGALRIPAACPVILDEHNIESEVFDRIRRGETALPRRAFNRLEHRRFATFERRWWRRASGCATTSERDARVVLDSAPATPTAVVPNGVDLDAFRPAVEPPRPHTAVFNGVLDYRPNLDAAQYLVDAVWPLVLERCPSARLELVGRGQQGDLDRLRRPGVDVTGEVPDVRPHLAAAAVVLVPVRMGGGTRLKVVEGLAMARPMVSTTLGCEGVDVRHGGHLLVADEPQPFAEAVVRLFEDRVFAETLGRAGRARVEEEYSWGVAGARLESLYDRALAVHGGPSTTRPTRPVAAASPSRPGS